MSDLFLTRLTPRRPTLLGMVASLESMDSPTPKGLNHITDMMNQSWFKGIACMKRLEDNMEMLVGYTLFKLYNDHITIRDMVINRLFRRMGVGSRLLDEAALYLNFPQRSKLHALVDETNVIAQLWLKKNKFRCVMTEKNPKGRDSYLFQRLYLTHPNEKVSQSLLTV